MVRVMTSDMNVPEGWVATTLGALGQYLNGRAFKTSEWSKTGRPIIRIQDLTGSNEHPNLFDGEVADRYVVRPGDLLVSWSATLGAFIWNGPEGVLNQHIFKVKSAIDSRLHYHLLRARIAELGRSAHGSGMVHVTKGTFDATPVVLPTDRAVQHGIAQFIDQLENRQKTAASHVTEARQLVERFSQAVVATSCSGRLTEDWRDDQIGTVPVDLVALASKRRAEDGKFGQPEMNRHVGTTALPASWVLGPLGLLVSNLRYGTAIRSEYGISGTPVLRIPNVSGPVLDIADLKYAKLSPAEKTQLTLRPDDLLMIRSNGSVRLVGKTVLVTDEALGMAFAGYLIRIRPDTDAVIPKYLDLALRSPQVRLQIEMPARSTSGINNINTAELRGLGIPLPPIAEQRVIVERVSKLLTLADGLVKRLELVDRDIEQGFQAVLSNTFRRDLAPPGMELL
jgi:type I restriction enzyme S subunit